MLQRVQNMQLKYAIFALSLNVKSANFALEILLQVQRTHLIFAYEVQEIMNAKKNKYEKRLEFQQKMIARQSEQIDSLKAEIEKLNNKLIEKDELINAIEPMRKEMAENLKEQKRLKEEYKSLTDELKKMKRIFDQTVYKGRWKLIKHLIK